MLDLKKEYEIIFSYLKSLNFHYLDEWVVQCVNYCKSSNPNITLEALKDTVKEQWLLVNLRSIKVPSLPSKLVDCHKTILHGKYVVQVEAMIDCSKSCFYQFQAILNKNLETVKTSNELNDWDIKSSRCLIFTISDGVQELKAMEYNPINKIRTNDPELLPGFKMLIIGPVECRKGMILLKEENLEILGGEVDTLIATNNLKSILIKKLNLNEEDYLETKNIISNDDVKSSNSDEIKNVINQSLCNNDQNQANIQSLLSQNDDLLLQVPLEPEILVKKCPQTSLINYDNIENSYRNENSSNCKNNQGSSKTIHYLGNFKRESLSADNIFDDVIATVIKKHDLPQEDKVMPLSKKLCEFTGVKDTFSAKKENLSFNSVSSTENQKVFIKKNVEPLNFQKKSTKNFFYNCSNNYSQNEIKQQIQTVIPKFFKSFNPPSLENHLPNKDATLKAINKKPVKISGKPFVYLKQILAENLCGFSTYIIKGTILTLKNKIKIENDQYNLIGTITDGSLSIDARFSSDIIESILEYSPCEIQEMMKIKKLNSAVEEKLKEAFKKSQQKFISLNCLMKIKFFQNNELPLILSLEEVNFEHLKALKERMII